jgi:hypothetical protein
VRPPTIAPTLASAARSTSALSSDGVNDTPGLPDGTSASPPKNQPNSWSARPSLSAMKPSSDTVMSATT